MTKAFMTLCALVLLARPLEAQLGTISFPNSGNAAAQPAFIRGVLLLHSFEYVDAAAAFREAQAADPRFALAYWGEALTYTHQVWNQQDVKAARAVLARLGATTADRLAAAKTPRERMYMESAELLYGDEEKPRRDTLFEQTVARISAAFPGDDEAKVFHALALLGLNQGVREEVAYMRAGAIASDVLRRNPDHPAAAHFVIHAFDDPAHAPLGLWAARSYSKIAPRAAHAQHMTTHIFLAMGMWDDVVSQNVIASGPDHEHWPAGHYTSWLGYGYLQQGRFEEARRHLEHVRRNAGTAMPAGARPTLVLMRAAYLIDSERWSDSVSAWSFAPIGSPTIRAVDAFARGHAAVKRGDIPAAEVLSREVDEAISATAGDNIRNDPQITRVLSLELRALVAAARGSSQAALQLVTDATKIEDALPVEFGPPIIIKPSHELAGDLLLSAGRHAEAQREYARALQLAPGRARSLLGLARAASRAGDVTVSINATNELLRNWHAADAGGPELAEMRALAPASRVSR